MVIGGLHRPSEQRRHTQQFESIRGYQVGVEALGSLGRGVQQVGAHVADYGVECRTVPVVVPEFGSLETGPRVGSGLIGVFDFDHHQAICIGVGKGLEQDAVDHTEDGGRCADAES